MNINSNPYRDRMTGTGYLEVYQRLQNYSTTYDNDERDRDRAVGSTDIFDPSGDAYVGQNMRFLSDSRSHTYEVKRFNGSEENPSKLLGLSFQESNGKVQVTQFVDSDGDRFPEVHRLSVIDKASGALEKQVDKA